MAGKLPTFTCALIPHLQTLGHIWSFSPVWVPWGTLCVKELHCMQGKALRKESIVQSLQEPVLCACHHYDSKRQFSSASTNPSCAISLEHPMLPYSCWLILWILLKVMTVKVLCAYFLASIYPLGVRRAKQFSFSYFWSHQCLSINFWQCSFTWSCHV